MRRTISTFSSDIAHAKYPANAVGRGVPLPACVKLAAPATIELSRRARLHLVAQR